MTPGRKLELNKGIKDSITDKYMGEYKTLFLISLKGDLQLKKKIITHWGGLYMKK